MHFFERVFLSVFHWLLSTPRPCHFEPAQLNCGLTCLVGLAYSRNVLHTQLALTDTGKFFFFHTEQSLYWIAYLVM